MPKISQTLVSKVVVDPYSDRCYWDNEVKGFGLKVSKQGHKTFIYQYRTVQQRSRRISIGSCDVYKAEQARSRAKEFRRIVDAGGDPMGDKQEAKAAERVKDMLNNYIQSERFKERATSTQKNDQAVIENHLIPTLGWKLLKELSPEDVRQAMAAIKTGKTAKDQKKGPRARAIVRGGDGIARKAIRSLRAAINWAIGEGKLESNPVEKVRIGADGVRDTIITADQYKIIFEALSVMESYGKIPFYVADAIRVIALTGARRSEISKLKWNDVQDGKLVIREHKTRSATGKSRIIQLSTRAEVIIAKQRKRRGIDYVFAPKGHVPDLTAYWEKVRAEAKLPKEITLHTMRHSLASGMAMQGFTAAEIMSTLGHSQLATTQRYIHWAEQERAKLADRASASVVAAMDGKAPAEVVRLREAK